MGDLFQHPNGKKGRPKMTRVLWIVHGLLVLLFLFVGALELVHYRSRQPSSRHEARDHAERHDQSPVRACCAESSE
jgi:hypothetical protein